MHHKLELLYGWLYPLIRKLGFGDTFASYTSLVVNMIEMVGVAFIIYWVFRFTLVTILAVVAQRTKTNFDDLLVNNKTAKYISYLIPFLFIYKSVPVILEEYVYWEAFFGKVVGVYIVVLTLWIIRSILKSIRDFLKEKPKYADKPIDSFIQVIMIMLWVVGSGIIISRIFEISTNTLVGTLGAVSAFVILIFRDTILGFVASVQVATNDMVRIGDWITFDKYGADGDVIEINLATVKVRNFDHTTTTIPTYSLISDSFRNWRGMLDSDGRRIKRSILIKAKSIRFLEEHELQKMKQIQLISQYIDSRQQEITKFNAAHQIDKSLLVNGRNMTNFGLFRKYITGYLEQHPGLNKNMILLCRQLQPTAQGIPLEIYAFSKDQRFEQYEYIMADIFDHVMASVPYFDLEIFELSATLGSDSTPN
ncbi:MAG: mechanosensitive ion channel family protein [Flavobacterium sp.]|jgi:miniconductance mechanosensitive channel|uniref:mechanosensitive ion channel family protein n=1 Tax=Flavobacterium sp. TaxID=239 RepID=UPI0022BDBDD0|nr:mechanosensitive ion channel domain-containing protein [Flavobacterium sp.]MCZ8169003.1 mechanosensitive ion channel [Flavobacterium sp.]MCZ8296347.1 mechanosensitive ion channel [Flavobacterium sp.]